MVKANVRLNVSRFNPGVGVFGFFFWVFFAPYLIRPYTMHRTAVPLIPFCLFFLTCVLLTTSFIRYLIHYWGCCYRVKYVCLVWVFNWKLALWVFFGTFWVFGFFFKPDFWDMIIEIPCQRVFFQIRWKIFFSLFQNRCRRRKMAIFSQFGPKMLLSRGSYVCFRHRYCEYKRTALMRFELSNSSLKFIWSIDLCGLSYCQVSS